MSNELARVQDLPMATMNDFVTAGQYLAKSGLLGINSAEQGFLVACTCHQTGISFIEFKQTYHIINNQLSKRSDKMQADFQKAGGVVEIIQKNPEGSIVKLTHGKTSYTSRCIWEEIKGEPFAVKSQNYATPRKRMQMMWARCISDGVRTVFPEVAAGVYTPEEVETFNDESPKATITPEEATRMATKQVEATVSQPVYTAPVQPTVLHPVSPSPVAPIQPQQAQQMAVQQESEPTPFTVLNDQANLDYTICPVEGTLFRMPWSQMPLDYLEAAMSLNIDQKYKDEILKVKQQKGNNA